MTETPQAFLNRITASIKAADDNGPLPDRSDGVLAGLSGLKTVGALQRLTKEFADDPTACYLEIGVFQGMTLLSVATHFPDFPCFGIDNFSILDPEGQNLNIYTERRERLAAHNATLINMDYEDALESLEQHLNGRKIAVYFVDGGHDYRAQLMCLMLAFPFLHERAVILVDDSNYRHVRQSTRDFLLTHPEYKLLFEGYSPDHPANLDRESLKHWEQGWLNGINIIVRDPENLLPVMLPPTERSRTLYENEHLVHRMQVAEMAPEAVMMAQALCYGTSADLTERMGAIARKFAQLQDTFAQRLPDRNTYSAGLPESRFNKGALNPLQHHQQAERHQAAEQR